MLYKKIIYTLATWAILTKTTFQCSTKDNCFTCSGNSSNTCHIYCDEADEKKLNFDCGNVDECYFHCDEQKCATQGTITATNSKNLYVMVGSNAAQCMRNSVVNTPQNGSAYFNMSQSKRGFRGMTINAGDNAKDIFIDIPGTTPYGDDIKQMEVFASTADFVSITFGNGLEWTQGILECPINSLYNGPEIAPCIIDASSGIGGIISDTSIVAQNGIPNDVYLIGGNISVSNTITCKNTITDTYPFDNLNDCWITNDPTTEPTLSPVSRNPTISPSKKATTLPTNYPTLLPIVSTSIESPTISSSVSQTTSNPSISPIPDISSSSLPTNSPLMASRISSTNSPTNSTQNIINEQEISESYSTTNNGDPGQQSQTNTHGVTLIHGVIYVVIGVVSCCIMSVLIGIVIYYCFRKHSIFNLQLRKKQSNKQKDNDVHIPKPALSIPKLSDIKSPRLVDHDSLKFVPEGRIGFGKIDTDTLGGITSAHKSKLYTLPEIEMLPIPQMHTTEIFEYPLPDSPDINVDSVSSDEIKMECIDTINGSYAEGVDIQVNKMRKIQMRKIDLAAIESDFSDGMYLTPDVNVGIKMFEATTTAGKTCNGEWRE